MSGASDRMLLACPNSLACRGLRPAEAPPELRRQVVFGSNDKRHHLGPGHRGHRRCPGAGFAYPHMRARFGWLPAALLLGVLWGLWHLPVVDSLRAASPHGRYWPEYFAAFIAVLAAIRVLIAWTYVHTGSLRMAQLLHASSTGFLVILSAPRVAPAQEAFWYFLLRRRAVGNCHHRRLAPAQAGSRPPPRSLSVVGVARRWTREIRSGRAGGRRRLAADPNRSIVMARRGLQGRLCLFFLARGAVLAGARPW